MHGLLGTDCGRVYFSDRVGPDRTIHYIGRSEKWLNRYKSRTGGIKFGPRKSDCNSLGYIRPFEDGYRMSTSYCQWPTSLYLTIMTFSLSPSRK